MSPCGPDHHEGRHGKAHCAATADSGTTTKGDSTVFTAAKEAFLNSLMARSPSDARCAAASGATAGNNRSRMSTAMANRAMMPPFDWMSARYLSTPQF